MIWVQTRARPAQAENKQSLGEAQPLLVLLADLNPHNLVLYYRLDTIYENYNQMVQLYYLHFWVKLMAQDEFPMYWCIQNHIIFL